MEIRWCAECKDDRAFDAPPCEDGHDLECLDLACAVCGWAIVTGFHDDLVALESAAA